MPDSGIEIVYLDEMPEAIEVLAPAFYEEWRAYDESVTLAHVTARFTACLQRDALPLALVARDGPVVLGTVGLRWDSISTRPWLGPWLAALWVHPARRRQGFGTQLIRAAEHAAARLGIPELYAGTSSAVRLFERTGWSAIEQLEYGGEPLTLFHRRIDVAI